MSTIPISQVVQMLPGTIAGGGQASKLSGLVVTKDTSVPPGQILNFFTPTDVSNWFGPAAPETVMANQYFPGIVNAGQLPFVLKFARYAAVDTPAQVFGAQLGNMTLAQLQALPAGTLIVTTTTQKTSAPINLATATSFANAAALMLAGFTSPDFVIGYDAQRKRFTFATTATGATATISAVTGTLATGVGLSAAAGATVAAGVAADTPATAMARVVAQDMNWGTFSTTYAAPIDERTAYAAWNSGQAYQFLYWAWDTEAASIVPNNTASFGATVFAQPYQGTVPVYGTYELVGAFMGYAASINFQIPNGRTNLAFRQFNGAPSATVSDLATANALLSNHYTYLGAYANAANTYTVAYNGALSGAFLWVDTYLDQIYLNRELQRAFFEALLAYNSLPYNQDGYTKLYRAGVDVIDAAVTSGIIRAAVPLSQSQQAQVDSQAGRTVSDVLQTRGWYLLIDNAANFAQARQNRTSPLAYLWYTDGGSIQQLTVRSIAVI
ncbi:DUF3383 domain-containing protein [uncultured Bradyrhizobium sp.]|uniref:DUF3383 domain-containing protein n=1 Tax=uncultured Bradyrhizobium sp. TaxID=199684 RepID=UPI002632769A|nr:DUF3383 domain-containing protein [uncultured Bradyrhizobium sp.]